MSAEVVFALEVYALAAAISMGVAVLIKAIVVVLARPDRAWNLAALTTVTSVLGGLAGFAIGALAIDAILPYLERWGYVDEFELAQNWFVTWGFWAVLAAGFSPIPYKVFTIAAGVAALNLPGFFIASLIGRGARFYLVAGLIVLGGDKLERNLRKYVESLGWAVVVIAVAIIGWLMARV